MLDFEITKLRYVRYGIVILQLYRMAQILVSYAYYTKFHFNEEEWFYALSLPLLLILFLFNKKMVWVSVLLAYFLPKFDVVFMSTNFSTAIFVLLFLLYASWNWRKNIYDRQQEKDESLLLKETDKIYFLFFSIFCVMNFFSSVVHFHSPYWKSGDAIGLILTHNYFSRHSDFFRNLLQTSPVLFHTLSQFFTYGLLISQLVIGPFYIFKRTRMAVYIFMISLLIWMFFIIGISFFSWSTLLLSIVIFVRKNPGDTGQQLLNIRELTAGFRRFFRIGFILMALFLMLKLPGLSKISDRTFWFIKEWDTKLFISKKLAYVGLFEPDVFNDNHIEGGQKWFVVYRLEGGKAIEVPFFDKHGGKQYYTRFNPLRLANHSSDFLYFGNIAQYVFGNDTLTYENSTMPYKLRGRVFQRLLRFDKNVHNPNGTQEYLVEFFERKYPNQNGKPSWDFTEIKTHSRRLTLGVDNEENTDK